MQHRHNRLCLTIIDEGLIHDQPALLPADNLGKLAQSRAVHDLAGGIVGIAYKHGLESRPLGRTLPQDLLQWGTKTFFLFGMNVTDRASCIQQRTRILLKGGTHNERGLDPKGAGQQMNQFRRAVTDQDHVLIDAAMLCQYLSELPGIGVRIVDDLLECRTNRTEPYSGRTQRIDAGAKIHDPIDGSVSFPGSLVDIPAVNGSRHSATIRRHPMLKRTPARLVQSISVIAMPICALVRG